MVARRELGALARRLLIKKATLTASHKPPSRALASLSCLASRLGLPPPPPRPAGSRAAAAMATEAQPSAAVDPLDFDKEQFRTVLTVKAVKVPAKQCHRYMKLLTPHLLQRTRVRNVGDIPGVKDFKLLLLQEGLQPEDFQNCQLAAPKSHAAAAPAPRTLRELIDQDGLEVTEGTAQLEYSILSASEVLRRLLPPGTEVPSSFESVGHVAHVNLREDVLPYRHLVGRVILDKNPRIRTVVNKLGSIENEWRVFSMEVVAGEDGTETEVRQHGARFRLDFRKVYWNSRLEAEHRRLVGEWLRPGQVLLDVMAGIGPFAVPAAQQGVRVFANDLNPDSYRWLVENVRLNRVEAGVSAYCVDGRQFMLEAAAGTLAVAPLPLQPEKRRKQQQQQQREEGGSEAVSQAVSEQQGQQAAAAAQPALAPPFDHAVMNLPATAVEFLDAFHGAFDRSFWEGRELPMVHVYAFLRSDQTKEDLQQRVEAALGGKLDAPPHFHNVRDVSPSKQMFCVSFKMPEALAFAAQDGDSAEGKRQRVE